MTENQNLTLLNIGYLNLNANWNWNDVYSPFARFYYVESGIARTRFNNNIYNLKPGKLYLTPPFTLHDDECDEPFSLYYIHFYDQAINRESVFERFHFPVEVNGVDLIERLVKRILEINPERQLGNINPKLYDNPFSFSKFIANNSKVPLHAKVETQGILHQLFARFLEFATKKEHSIDKRIEESLRYIRQHINNNITISQLAGMACLTDDHYIRIFKKEVGQTPLKFINQKKIEQAQLLLLSSTMPIREIAAMLSMENISYFNRIFKQYTADTPSAYRAKYLR